MEKIGKEINSKPLWEEISASYVDALETRYHKHRLEVIFKLLPQELFNRGNRVLDFGCGDGVLFPFFLNKGVDIFGIDISENIVELGKQRLLQLNQDPRILMQGNIESLKNIGSNSLNGILCFNTLAYFTDEEERTFYQEAKRTIKKNGYLAVSHSNELFDLYTLNRYTVEFFKKYLISSKDKTHEVAQLLRYAEEPSVYTTYNIRENPLAYKHKLLNYGFEEIKQLFSNLYDLPPLALKLTKVDSSFNFDRKNYPDTTGVDEIDKWKLMFICSTYMSLSQKF